MKKVFLITLLFICSEAHAVTLTDTLVSAYNNNPKFLAKQKELMARDELVPQAYSGWLPEVSVGVDYGRTRDKTSGSLFNRGGETYDTLNTKQLNVVQPVFNGGESYARTKKAYNLVDSSREDLRFVEQEILNLAVTSHMDVVKDYQILELSKHNELVLKEQLQSTKDRFRLGETTKTDVAQSEARYARAISDTIRARGQLTASLAQYLKNIGEQNERLAPSPDKFAIPTNNVNVPKTLREAIEIALVNNPDLRSRKSQENAAGDEVDIAYSALLPDLSLRGNMTKREDRQVFSGDITDSDSLTLNLTVPLYQSGAEYSRVREAKNIQQNLKYTTSQTTNRIRESVIKAWEDIVTSRSSIISNQQAVQAATVALNGVKQEAEVGARTVLDVLDAEQELFSAKVNLVNSQRNEIVALYNLKFFLGTLTAKDIGLPVKLFDPEENFKNVRYKPIGFN